MPTYRCAYCQGNLGAEPRAHCPHCGKAMILPQTKDTQGTRRKRRQREPEDTGCADLPFVRPGKNPAILGAIILVFIVLGTLLTSRIQTQPDAAVPQVDLEARARREVDTLTKALQMYQRDTGRYPSEAEGLVALVQNPGIADWGGHYVNVIKPDPWKTPYRYSLTPDGMEVRSAGPDRTFGTAADIFTTMTAD